MAEIQLHNDKDTSATYVSNHFIDHYMAAANGEYVKIYLYLLRCMNSTNSSFSLSSLADKFEHTEKDIQRALLYWEKMHLLRLEYNKEHEILGIYFLDADKTNSQNNDNHTLEKQTVETHNSTENTFTENTPTKTLETQQAEQVPTKTSLEIKQPNYTATQLNAFQEDDKIRELVFVTEHYLKRPLMPTDLNALLFWYDELKFSTDLIEYLVEYCLSKGHNSLRYMEKVALAWKKDGIETIEQARCASSSFTQLHFSIMRAMGISGRNLVPTETAFIDKWSKTYGFSQEIITEACRRTISSIHQPSFEYANKILTDWHNEKVRSLSDIKKLDSTYRNNKKTSNNTTPNANTSNTKTPYPNKFHNFKQRNYDYQQLEQQLLNQSSP